MIGNRDILIGDGNNGCLVLGHIAELHYVSLRAIKGKSLGVDKSADREKKIAETGINEKESFSYRKSQELPPIVISITVEHTLQRLGRTQCYEFERGNAVVRLTQECN